MANAVNADPLFTNRFGVEFDSFINMVKTAHDLLAESVDDPADDISGRLVLNVLSGALQVSNHAKMSLIDIQAELERRMRGMCEDIAETAAEQVMLNAMVKGPLYIADRAIQVDTYATAERYAKEALHEAYDEFKREAEIDHVERDSSDWDLMMEATKPEYEVLQKAKRDHRNARRRLETAIRRHRLNSFSLADAAA